MELIATTGPIENECADEEMKALLDEWVKLYLLSLTGKIPDRNAFPSLPRLLALQDVVMETQCQKCRGPLELSYPIDDLSKCEVKIDFRCGKRCTRIPWHSSFTRCHVQALLQSEEYRALKEDPRGSKLMKSQIERFYERQIPWHWYKDGRVHVFVH